MTIHSLKILLAPYFTFHHDKDNLLVVPGKGNTHFYHYGDRIISKGPPDTYTEREREELACEIMAEKSPNLQLASWKPRRTNGIVPGQV